MGSPEKKCVYERRVIFVGFLEYTLTAGARSWKCLSLTASKFAQAGWSEACKMAGRTRVFPKANLKEELLLTHKYFSGNLALWN